MSSPRITTFGSRASMMSMAEFSAWIMFICGMSDSLLGAHLFALLAQVLRHLLEHVLEHQVAVQARAVVERSVLHGFLPALGHLLFQFGCECRVPLLRPLAERDQVVLEAQHRVAE